MSKPLSIDLGQTIKDLIKNDPGKERGEDLKYLVDYVKKRKGDDGFERVKSELKKYNFTFPDLSKIDDMDWIPTHWVNVFFITSLKVFNWGEEDIVKMSKQSIAFKSLMKYYVKYFLTPEKTIKISARDWRKHYDFGQVEVLSDKDKKNAMIFKLIGFKIHPLTCLYLMSLISRVIEISSGSEKVFFEERKCECKGAPYNEYYFQWGE